MSMAERLYRMLLRLYPPEHRRAYGELMVQHARDLSRTARRQGRWQVVQLSFNLFMDGVHYAAVEHLEAIKMANNHIKPVPWPIVLLAAFPGLLVALTRQIPASLSLILAVLGYLYLAIILFGPAIIWWRTRRFPVWALLPAGIVLWILVYLAGTALARGLNFLLLPHYGWVEAVNGIAFLALLLALVLFVVLLRSRRLPVSTWLGVGAILAGYLLLTVISIHERYGSSSLNALLWYLTVSGIGPTDGLLFVAAGLLAVRRHGVFAILVVVGGYAYMCGDSDFLWGSPVRDWPYLGLYLAAIAFLYMAVVPIALLRAKTGLGRAAAVFIPVFAFHLGRLIIPGLVIQGTFRLPWGDSILSANVLLSLALAWLLYSQIDSASRKAMAEDQVPAQSLPA